MSKESLINKYRPKTFKEVIGQDAIVDSFQTALEERTSHAFLFYGPAGCGKTSLVRLGAKFLGADPKSIREISAAVHNSVEHMRELEESLAHKPLYGTIKIIIMDECHRIRADGWDVLLKIIEESPKWVVWFFCTTNITRIPKTIQTRLTMYTVQQVSHLKLFELLDWIVEEEKFDTSRQIIELCVKNSDGSPRKAISNLSACYMARDRTEALSLIVNNEVEEAGAAYKIARAISQNQGWKHIQPLLIELSEEDNFNPESARHVIRAYFTKMAIGTKDDCPDEKTVCFALSVLDNFLEFFNSSDGISPLVAAVGRVIFRRV